LGALNTILLPQICKRSLIADIRRYTQCQQFREKMSDAWQTQDNQYGQRHVSARQYSCTYQLFLSRPKT
jgi:hypothetical protein